MFSVCYYEGICYKNRRRIISCFVIFGPWQLEAGWSLDCFSCWGELRLTLPLRGITAKHSMAVVRSAKQSFDWQVDIKPSSSKAVFAAHRDVPVLNHFTRSFFWHFFDSDFNRYNPKLACSNKPPVLVWCSNFCGNRVLSNPVEDLFLH